MAGAGNLVLAVADRHRGRLATQFVAAMTQVGARITEALVADAMGNAAHLSTILQMIDAAPVIKDATSDAIAAYADMASEAGRATVSMWMRGLPISGAARQKVVADLSVRLDVKSSLMQAAARDMTAKLVTQVNAETKRAIRGTILQATRNGASPYETSQLLRNVVGLTSQQSLAVMNYRNGLIGARDGTRSLGALANRFGLSPKVNPRATLNPMQVDAYTQKYAARLLDYRAYNIARTESLYAANMGQQMTWKAMANAGYIDGDAFRRVWVVVDDDRLCEECAPMDGQAVGLDDDFVSDETGVLPSDRVARDADVTTETPPLHPSCRCVITAEGDDITAAFLDDQQDSSADDEPAGPAAQLEEAPVVDPEACDLTKEVCETPPDWSIMADLPGTNFDTFDQAQEDGAGPVAAFGGKTGEDLVNLTNQWQSDYEAMKSIRSEAEQLMAGAAFGDDATLRGEAILRGIDAAPELRETLYRGIAVDDDPAALFQPGANLDIPPSSFTGAMDIAVGHATELYEGTPVIISLEGGAKSMAISAFSSEESLWELNEYVSGGRYSVVSSKQGDDYWQVVLRQTGTFEVPE